MQPTTPDPAEALNLSAGQKRARGDLAGALVDYSKAIELRPDFAAAYSNRSVAKLAAKDFVGALADVEKAIALNPDFAAAYEKIRHREGMGLGDVKMMALMGAFLGLRQTLATFFLASVVGAVLGILFIWLAKKEAKTYELPFGSFLGAAAIVVGFWLH